MRATKKPTRPTHDPSQFEQARAIGLSGDFSALYVAVFNAMHEEAAGSDEELRLATESRLKEAVDALALMDADNREDALVELATASTLYWCLRSSLDRPQKYSVVRGALDALRHRLIQELAKLDAIEFKPASPKRGRTSSASRRRLQERGASHVSYERDFLSQWEIQRQAVVVDGIVRSRLFEHKARQYLRLVTVPRFLDRASG